MKPTVNKEQLQAEFSDRLNAALDHINFNKHGAGRQTELAQALGVDSSATRKWLTGKGYPGSKNLQRLADFTGESKAFLRYAEGQSRHAHKGDKYVTPVTDNVNLSNLSAGPVLLGVVPLILLEDIGQPVDIEHSDNAPESPNDFGAESGASLVEGTSMTQDKHPSYPNGCYIYWRLAEDANVGERIVAKLPDGTNVFRELDKDGGKFALKPLNSQYPIITTEFTIVAVVTGKYEPEQIKRESEAHSQ